ncbi:hypothetical protein DRP77_10150 [Candidatus Poribacteria bacterium]|nr:MAG: hypothetical protein DRP77_10150 [Candidatus Poribacteria bacterium]
MRSNHDTEMLFPFGQPFPMQSHEISNVMGQDSPAFRNSVFQLFLIRPPYMSQLNSACHIKAALSQRPR